MGLNKGGGKTLVTESKVLRKTFGPVIGDTHWRIRRKVQLKKFCRDPNIRAFINLQRLRQSGHLQGMDDERNTKKINQANSHQKQLKGRPQAR
jgi:hypothetical protein